MPHYRNTKVQIWRAILSQSPIQAAVLDGFGDMRGLNVLGSFKICDGARDFEDAGVGAGAQPELVDRDF